MNYAASQAPLRWQKRLALVPSVYRSVAFGLALSQLLLFTSDGDMVVSPTVLLAVAGIYTVFKVVRPFRLCDRGIVNFISFVSDAAVCLGLVHLTDGLTSPFLLYSLTPVLTAALWLSPWRTLGTAVLSVALVFGFHLTNPAYMAGFSAAEVSALLGYLMAAGLITTLPYLLNVTFRQYLEAEDILRERRRLSQEIHDTTTQTIAALRWQIQLLRQRLVKQGIEQGEVREVARLAARAYQESRESLELLRDYTGDGSLIPHLKDYLEHLKDDAGIDFLFDVEADKLRLEAPVELQLLRICQEALTNVRNHSGAQNIYVKVISADHHLAVSIADDGCGFDALAYYGNGTQSPSQGLDIMRERAESVGGKLSVLSMTGRGTEIQVDMPVNSGQGRLPW